MKLAVALLTSLFYLSNCESVYAYDCKELPKSHRAKIALATHNLECLKTAVTTADEANAFQIGSPIAFFVLIPPWRSDDALRHLLETGLDPNIKNEQETVLGYSILWGRISAAESLIDAGADVNLSYNAMGKESWPLNAAAYSGYSNLVVKLVEAGADVNYTSARGDVSALDTAILKGRPDITRLLLEAGADVEDNGVTKLFGKLWPLDAAARAGNIEIGRLLIEHNADVNRQSESQGTTALHSAIFYRNFEFVELLLEAGADLHLEDNRGLSPLQLAESVGMKISP